MAVLFSDSFDRSNRALDGDNGWSAFLSTASIVSNVAVDDNPAGADLAIAQPSLNALTDYYTQAEVTVTGGGSGGGLGAGFTIRGDGAGHYYRVVVGGGSGAGTIELALFNPGYSSIWQRNPATLPWPAGAVLRVEMHGTTIRVFQNGIQVGADTIDASIASGRPGLGSSAPYTSGTWNNFEVGTLGWRLVQFKSQANGGTLAFDSAVGAGSFIVVGFEGDGAEKPNPITPTDTRGTPFNVLRPKIVTVNGQVLGLWGGISPSAGSNTVTAENTSTFDGMVIAEFAYEDGLSRGVTLDDSDDNYIATLSAGANGVVGDAMDSSGADGLVLMLLGTDNGGGMTFTNGAEMIATQTTLSGAGSDHLVLAFKNLSATGSTTPSLTGTGGSGTSGQILEAIVYPTSAADPTFKGSPRRGLASVS